MLTKSQVAHATKEVQAAFAEPPDILVKVSAGVVTYEVQIFAPYLHNVGRGISLLGAVQHLKQLNHKE